MSKFKFSQESDAGKQFDGNINLDIPITEGMVGNILKVYVEFLTQTMRIEEIDKQEKIK